MNSHGRIAADAIFASCDVGEHTITSLVAADEPERQRLRALADLERALPSAAALDGCGASIDDLATTPDFHPGRPVPVGVVAKLQGAILPHLVGNDIGCGMRLMSLDGVQIEDVVGNDSVDRHLRHLLFQGGRDLALTGRMRRALLEEGVFGLLQALLKKNPPGLLRSLNCQEELNELERISDLGSLEAGGLDPGFADFAALDDIYSRDAILGSLGGGNHFLELGVVDAIADAGFAKAAGLKLEQLTLCVHSGSLDFGQRVGRTTARALAERSITPGDPRILPLGDPLAKRYLTALANAGNAAFGNRMFLALAGVEAIRRATGKTVTARLAYDAPHNMAWHQGDHVLHRKGACPARGGEVMAGTPFAFLGEPVILPGSMGDATWLLAGTGHPATLQSSAHGAGRRLSRGEARREAVGDIDKAKLRVVGPIDLHDPRLQGRKDVLTQATARLAEEAPRAYRPIAQVMKPMERAGVVNRAVRLRPLMTAKG
jgi:tRNA-splicing ligase RtcB